jgi:hypothetical protein
MFNPKIEHMGISKINGEPFFQLVWQFDLTPDESNTIEQGHLVDFLLKTAVQDIEQFIWR